MGRAKGIDTYLAFGGESTWGTAGTLDLFLRLVTHSLVHAKEPFFTESLNDDWHSDIYYSAGKNEGDLVFEMVYEGGIELFLHSLMGTYTHTPNSPVSGAHTHVFTFDPTTNAFPTGISAQPVNGIGGSDEMTFTGLHARTLSLAFANRQIVRATFGMIGQKYARGSATSPTFPTFRPVLPAHKSVLQIDGNTFSIISGTIEIDTQKPDREHYGEAYFKEALVQDRPRATFSFECEYASESGEDTDAIHEAYLNETALSSGFQITHLGDIITGATQYTFSVQATEAWVTGTGPTVQGPGLVPITLSGEVTEGLSMSLVNATAAAVT